MELLGDVGHVELCFDPIEIVFVLVRDRCTVCAECTIGSKIGLDAADGTLGDVGQVESCFGPFGDSISVGGR